MSLTSIMDETPLGGGRLSERHWQSLQLLISAVAVGGLREYGNNIVLKYLVDASTEKTLLSQ